MLVLHPTSRCDICLDDYTWVTPKHSPHAIACGHIFCLICLEQLQPSTCPLCRKHFQPNKVKKLHVDRVPDEPDGSNRLLDSHSNVLLQRIAMVSGDRAPDADVAEVITEVFQWLENESDALNANQPLKYAVKALQKHKALAEKYNKKKDELAALETSWTSLQRDAERDLETSRKVEEGLLARLEEVDTKWASKLLTAENQLAELRTEMSRYKGGSNPLPPPPQPLPIDRFPGFARIEPGSRHDANGNGNGRGVYLESTQHPSRRTRRTESVNVNGTHASNGNGTGSAHTQAVFIPSTEKEKHKRRVPGTGAESSKRGGHRDRPAQGEGSSSRHSSTRPGSSSQPQNKYPGVHPRAKIIPGAYPEERIIPPREPLPPKFMRDETPPTSSRRPHEGHRRLHQGVNEYTSSSGSRYGGRGGASDGESDEVELERRLDSASAFVAGYGSGYEEGLGYAASAASYRPYIPPPPPPLPSSFGVQNMVASMQSVSIDSDDVLTPRVRPGEPPTATAAWGSSGRVPTASAQPGLQQLDQILHDHPPRPRDSNLNTTLNLPMGDTPGRQSLHSVSSWGTVPTPSASSRGSFSDLNLIGLPQTVVVRGEETETETEGEEGADERGVGGLLGTYPPRAVQTASSMGFTVEPLRLVHTQGYFSEDERPTRHHRSFSHPHAATQNETAETQTRSQHHRRHSVTQSVSLDSGSLPPMGLGLTFDPSSSTLTHEGIRAPAPRMGGPNVLTHWRA